MTLSTYNLDNLLKNAVDARVSPAIAATIGSQDQSVPRYSFVSGTLQRGVSPPCTKDTLFDLASLTKVLSTTLMSAEAILLGKLSLDEKPFPQWPSVKVVDLLTHTSGLPAWKNLYKRGLTRREIFDSAHAIGLSQATGAGTVYSDIGFIALGDLLESRLKERIDVVFDDLSKRYYGNSSLAYRPIGKRVEATNVAPTGFCPTRRRHLKGEVNDLNAYGLCGVAPHAGLFGTLKDVEKAALFFLSAITMRDTPIAQILAQFASANGRRGIGFDKAERKGAATGGALSLAVGHLGFTGTSFWIDPAANNGRGAYLILLTNHLEISPRKKEIMQLLRDFHQAGAQSL